MDGFQEIAEVMREAERRASLAGVPANRAMEILMRAEAELIRALAESRRDARQFILQLKEQGASRLASEKGCSRATIYNKRARALNTLSNYAIGKLDTAA